MNTVYITSTACGSAGIIDARRATSRAPITQRLLAWWGALSLELAQDAHDRRIRAAYRDLPVSVRVDLGIDRRRA